MTRESTASLWSGEMASDCWASSTWIGPKKPDHSPMLASTSQVTQSRETGSVGSASARAAGWDGRGHAAPARWARMTSAYQSKERLGVRTRVSKSTCTSPNRWVNPCGPLEVVQQRPAVVAADVDAPGDGVADGAQVGVEVVDPRLVVDHPVSSGPIP